MQDILYNPIEKKFKNPVGAVLQNEESLVVTEP